MCISRARDTIEAVIPRDHRRFAASSGPLAYPRGRTWCARFIGVVSKVESLNHNDKHITEATCQVISSAANVARCDEAGTSCQNSYSLLLFQFKRLTTPSLLQGRVHCTSGLLITPAAQHEHEKARHVQHTVMTTAQSHPISLQHSLANSHKPCLQAGATTHTFV